ncbi:uncharacterized protein LOC120211275 [Hibiscus syriacus]|uniref:uncharacterized protein LOC120211275 n=1 Tax=Hibiscus syriacus TaxID=106335 RepID=UPI0019226FE9|nr:uncharacterized protein LOC120211275 [Hibiscus syriacus]
MENKHSFSLILCCFLLASLLLFPPATGSRILQQDYDYEEGDNGQTKAGVRRIPSKTAPSWGNTPPTPTDLQSWKRSYEAQVRQQAESEARSEACQWTRGVTNTYCDP